MTKYHSFPLAQLRQIVVVMAIFVVAPILARADVKLPLIFEDHMVLQRDNPIPVWGRADPGEEITVTFGDDRVTAKADPDGKWRVFLNKTGADAKPRTLTIKGKNTVKFEDVLVGDVWVCAGQSNMEFYLGQSHKADVDVPAAHDPQLRLFRVLNRTSIKPQEDVALWNGKKWMVCNPEDAKTFTAVGYYFGRELRKNLNIPIGLIYSAQGGSKAQLWTSLDAIEENTAADPEFKSWLEKRQVVVDNFAKRQAEYPAAKEKYDQDIRRWSGNPASGSEPKPQEPEPPDGGPYNSFMVGTIYNAMIAPLTHFAIKGVIWYQGESNCENSRQYHALFPILITNWREKWGQGNFPFLFVQLPNLNKPATEPVESDNGCFWTGIRDAQAKALALTNTGMATTIDVGDPYNVHGKDKYDVGYRLSLVARHLVYGEDIVCTGPVYDSMNIEGQKILISFKSTGGGLEIGTPPWSPSGKIPPLADKLKGFAIAGADRKWVWAKALIQGDQVVVWSELVSNPVAVRYGWADNPPCNLYNRDKLPAAPFRTDDWQP